MFAVELPALYVAALRLRRNGRHARTHSLTRIVALCSGDDVHHLVFFALPGKSKKDERLAMTVCLCVRAAAAGTASLFTATNAVEFVRRPGPESARLVRVCEPEQK